MRLAKLFTIPVMLLLTVSSSSFLSANGKQAGIWEKMPLPTPSGSESNKIQYIKSFKIDKNGTPWIIIESELYYWNGNAFCKPSGNALEQYMGNTYVVGGEDRDLYLVQLGTDQANGKVYLLANGKVSLITQCYMNRSQNACPLYVSRSGKLYNWGSRFLAVYMNGSWKRAEINLDIAMTSIFDTENAVYFYYNGNLGSVDNNDNIKCIEILDPNLQQPGYMFSNAALWGKETIILVSSDNRAKAIDLQNMQSIALPENIARMFSETRYVKLFSLKNGNVLVQGRSDKQDTVINVITKDSQIKSILSANLQYSLTLYRELYNTLPLISDNSFWASSTPCGLIHIKDNKIDTFDWRSGAPMSVVKSIQYGKDNKVYTQTDNAVYAYNPGGSTNPEHDFSRYWQEYIISSAGSVQDSQGRIWCFFADQPGKISYWNGQQWNHISFPKDTDYFKFAAIDSQGHVVLENYRIKAACYVVSPENIKEYNNIEDAFAALLANGAKWFETFGEYGGCVIDKGDRIAFAKMNSNYIQMWNGKSWEKMTNVPFQTTIFESSKYGFLINHSESDKYYTYDQGQLVLADVLQKNDKRRLLGSNGIQPYDEILLRKYPDKYLEVEAGGNGVINIPAQNASDQAQFTLYNSSAREFIRGKGYSGGFWLNLSRSNDIVYTLGKRFFLCDFSSSPFSTINRSNIRLYEDAGNNLWIYAGFYLGQNHLFMYINSPAEIKLINPPAKASHSAILKVKTNNLPENSEYFWRMNDGQWNFAQKDNLRVVFPGNGKHSVQVKAVNQLGGTVAVSAPISVESKAGYPQTILVDKGPFIIESLTWQLPVSGKTTSKNAQMEYSYRIDTGEWKSTTQEKEVLLNGLSRGSHKIEIAAVEEGVFKDPKPLTIDFTYSPNIKQISTDLLESLTSVDTETRKQAISLLKVVDIDIINEVHRQIRVKKEIYNNKYLIESAMDQIENR